MTSIFIAGGSASGKTELTTQLLKKFKEFEINCISLKMDDYYKEIPDGVDIAKYKQSTNFDDPNCMDLKLLQKHITNLGQGESIDKPVFDFNVERRVKIETITSPEILLLEGTYALYFANHFCHGLHPTFKIFIEAQQNTLLKRRIKRDVMERGYADEKSIIKKDTEYVRPTFLKFVEPTKVFADMLIPNDETCDLNTQPNPFTFWAEKIVAIVSEPRNGKSTRTRKTW